MISNTSINIANQKSRLLRISSEDKVDGTNTRFTINFGAEGGTLDNIYGYLVKHISCPNLFKNVPAYANTIRVIKTTGAVVYDVTIPVGQYTVSQLATALQDNITTAIGPDSVGVVVSTASGDSSTVLRFTWVGDTYSIDYDNSTIRDIIGLTEDIGPAVFYDLQSEVNLIGESELYVHCRELNPNGLTESGGSFSVVDVLNLDVPYGAVAYSDYYDDEMHFKKYYPYITPRTVRTLNIVLRNRQGRVLTLPDNFYFNMILKVFYK
jgi:hypothetical protein